MYLGGREETQSEADGVKDHKRACSLILCEEADATESKGKKCNRKGRNAVVGVKCNLLYESDQATMLPWKIAIVFLFYCCIQTGVTQQQTKGKS